MPGAARPRCERSAGSAVRVPFRTRRANQDDRVRRGCGGGRESGRAVIENPFLPGVVEPDASDDDWWFVFRDGRLLVAAEGDALRVPRRVELGRLGVLPARPLYLGRLGTSQCFAGDVSGDAPALDALQWQGLRSLFGRIDELVFALAGRASQIVEWDRTHRFCGRCGSAMGRHRNERAAVCANCALTCYPRLSPAAMVLIRRGRELLLARSPHFAKGMYSALAGFVEPGESLEQTLVREVREEVGVEIANVRYFGSQSWPFPHSLMIAFVADYAGGAIVPQPDEIEAADWFSIDALPSLPHHFSIARRLIDATLAEIEREISGGGDASGRTTAER